MKKSTYNSPRTIISGDGLDQFYYLLGQAYYRGAENELDLGEGFFVRFVYDKLEEKPLMIVYNVQIKEERK